MKKFLLYLLSFYILYTPNIGNLTKNNLIILIFSKYVIISIFLIICFFILIKSKFRDKDIKVLYGYIFFSSLYFMIIAILNSHIEMKNIRLIQNNFIIIHVSYFLLVFYYFRLQKFSYEYCLKFIFNLTMIQACISIFMIFIPSLKNIALSLYYGNNKENIFITKSRIYGISEDYTFATPIFHSMMAMVSMVLGLLYDKKYYIYAPFLLLISAINGRTGLLIFFVTFFITYIYIFVKYKSKRKDIIKIFIIILLISLILIMILKLFIPDTYHFIYSGFNEIVNLIFFRNKVGTFNILFNNMLFFPPRRNFIFGMGKRVYNSGLKSSDIGYVNDMFMGGIVYIALLYIPIIVYLLKKSSQKDTNSKNINCIISINMIIYLLIANFKGEVMKGGILLLGVILIKYLITKINFSYKLLKNNF